MKRWTPVKVVWSDSSGSEDGRCQEPKMHREIHGCITVGMLYRDDPDRVTVVLSRDPTSRNVCGYITIPRVAITSLDVLA